MAKRISPTTIGIFVVSSLALLVVTLVILGSGRLFQKQHRFVCFFGGSLNGLKIGAPVKVRGVEIGTVVEIMLRLPSNEGKMKEQGLTKSGMPVVIEIDETQLTSEGGRSQVLQAGELSAMIQRGLRAQLATESFLTGLLYIDLDLHPNSPARMMLESGSGKYLEIPTVPTNLQQVQERVMDALAKLDKIDFEGLVVSITTAANSAAEVLSSSGIKDTLLELREAAKNLNRTMSEARDRVVPFIATMKKTSESADRTLEQATAMITRMQNAIAPGSPLAYRLDTALNNMSEASNAIRQLADLLQRNPTVLIRGRYNADNQ